MGKHFGLEGAEMGTHGCVLEVGYLMKHKCLVGKLASRSYAPRQRSLSGFKVFAG